jgi:hypothetical protein
MEVKYEVTKGAEPPRWGVQWDVVQICGREPQTWRADSFMSERTATRLPAALLFHHTCR